MPSYFDHIFQKEASAILCVEVLVITARKRSLGRGNIFTPVCHSVHRGVPPPGGGASSGGGVLPPGGCLVETPRDGYCCGRYASYWNTFLFTLMILVSRRHGFPFKSNITSSESGIQPASQIQSQKEQVSLLITYITIHTHTSTCCSKMSTETLAIKRVLPFNFWLFFFQMFWGY